jgi:CheY-like chemotaxis protein
VRDSLRSIMRAEGMRRITTFGRAEDLIEAMKKAPPDLLLLADDFDEKEKEKDTKERVFNLVRDVRHFRLGTNPFILITILIGQDNENGIKKAVQSGADDVLIKPLQPGRLLERIGHLAFNRLQFIATTDYVGPERRRGGDRPSIIPRLEVVNTLRDKVEGKRLSTVQLTRAITQSMRDVLVAQLDSFHLKLAYAANLIIKAYTEKDYDADRKKQFNLLVSVVEDAAMHAKRLRRDALAEAWTGLIPGIREIEQSFSTATPDLPALQGLPRVFEATKAATPAEEQPAPNAERQQVA